jgi:hypothetical protein
MKEKDLKTRIKDLLLLNKPDPEREKNNILAVMGLFAIDFPDPDRITLVWDENDIAIMSRTPAAHCTCQMSPDPKSHKVGDDWHGMACALVIKDHLLKHSCLVDVDDDDRNTTWTFQWPRNIMGYRNTLVAQFPELKDEALWKNFVRSWGDLAAMMPEAVPSLAERLAEEEEAPEEEPPATEPEPEVEKSPDSSEANFEDGLDFDMPIAPPVEEPEAVEEPLPANQELETKLSKKTAPKEDPPLDAQPQAPETPQAADNVVPLDTKAKRKPGRPRATEAPASAQEKELAPADFRPKEEKGKKVYPAVLKFSIMAMEEIMRLGDEIKALPNAEGFPTESIRGIKTSLDRLALRTAHLEFRGPDSESPNAINPLVEVTLQNVIAVATTACRDLGLAPEKAASWEAFVKNVKDAKDKAGAMYELFSQIGAGPVIQADIPGGKHD